MNAKKTQLYILTGFLGSGKTTVLKHILNALPGKKIGIIQNEFGKISIDGEILRNDDIKTVELNRGTIFCTCLRLSFVKALAEMAAYHFDYLFVESSGWGDPSNVMEILEAAAVLCGHSYDFKGVLCLVDGVNFLQQLSEEETVYRQLKHCHLALLSKADLMEEGQYEAVANKIREINPACKLLPAVMGQIELDFLKEDLMQYSWAEGEDTTNSAESKPKTLFMEIYGSPKEEAIRQFLLSLSPHLYRAKGFCPLQDKGWRQIDLVGSCVDIKPCEEKELSRLVFISKIGPAIIKEILPAWEQLVQLPMKLRN